MNVSEKSFYRHTQGLSMIVEAVVMVHLLAICVFESAFHLMSHEAIFALGYIFIPYFMVFILKS